MEISYQLLFENLHEGMTDEEHMTQEMRLADLVEPLGFDGIWCVEHHFDGDYSMCPDNMQLLSYVAARTERVKIVTAAVILPWWSQPIRVAEKLVMLDHLSKGRLVVGFGRGLAKDEYGAFGIDMGESRERFDESADLILRALDTGIAKGTGPFYPQPETPIRPAPTRRFDNRLICIAMSPDSLDVAAGLGAGMATFVYAGPEVHKPLIDGYKEAFQRQQGRPAPTPNLTEFVYCHEDAGEAERVAREYVTRYYAHFMRHYSMADNHFADTKGYATYATLADSIREAGVDAAAEAYLQAQTWGTPEQIVEKVRAKREVIGDYNLNCFFSFGGLSYAGAEASMRLWAEKVNPVLADLGSVKI